MINKLLSKIRKNKFTVLVTVFVVVLISITLGSAIINSVLTLTGNTKIKENRWLIHFDFVQNIEASNPNSDHSLDARITDVKKENIAFSTTFKNVGDYYEFNVYTWNEGTIDAMIDDIELEIPNQYKNNIKYSIHYDDADINPEDTIQISENRTKNLYDSRYDYSKTLVQPCDPLYADTMRKIIVRIQYKSSLDDLDEDQNINFNLKIKYVQDGPCPCEETGTCDTEVERLLRIRPNGGKYNNKTTETKVYMKEGETYTFTSPSRALYNFTGWNVISPSENGTYTFENNVFTMGEENVIIEANWEEGNYVARIMDTYFPSIQDAFDAVDSKNWKDNTVWLLKDTTEYPVNTATHAFKFNLDGHTVTGTIQNNRNSTISIINGIVRAEERLTDEEKEDLPLNKKHEAAFINYGTFNLGEDDGIVNIENSITLIGNEYGLLNFYDDGSTFNFYDGYIEGDTAIEDGYNGTPEGYYVFINHNESRNCQRAYLIPNPSRAVAKTTTKGIFHYYSLQDAIHSVETYKKDNPELTDNDYVITVTRDFEAAYPITVENERVFINTDGKEILTGEAITNNGYLKIYNGNNNNRSNISASVSINNNGTLLIDNLYIASTTDDNVINNKGNLTLTKADISGNNGYGINNSGNGKISADSNTTVRSNSTYGLYNSSNGLNVENATIHGIYNTGTMSIGDNTVVTTGTSNLVIYNTGTINMNNGTIDEEDNRHYIIENRGTFNLKGGNISNDYSVINNYSVVNVTGGTITSNQTAIAGYTINVRGGTITTTNGNAINGENVNVYDGTISSENGDGVHSTNARIYGGEINSDNAIGVYASEDLLVEDGTIHGHTYALYGHNVSIKGGDITSDEVGVYAYLYRRYSTDYPGQAGMTGGNIVAIQKGIESDYFEMSEGIVESDFGAGVTVKRSATITGGTIIGETYGIHNKGTLTLGTNDGEISTTEPLVIGKSYGLYIEEDAVTNFYDGILKGQINAHHGDISGTPSGAIVTYGSDVIDEEDYETAYLIVYKNWLRVGTQEFNTVNAASKYIQDFGEDGDSMVVFDDAPDLTYKQEFVEGSKKVVLDLDGHTLTTTQPIYNNGSNSEIIDSSLNHSGTIITKKNVSLQNNEGKRLTIDGGNYISHTKYSIQNDGTLVSKSGTYNADNTAIYTRGELIIDDINIESSINGIEVATWIEYVDHTIYDTGMVVHAIGSVEMNGGSITSSNYGIYSEDKQANLITINDGTITGTKRGISVSGIDIHVTGGTITANDEYAIYNYGEETTVDGGTITSNNSTAIFMAHPLTVNGGTITGKTYGVYTDQYCDAYLGSCGYPSVTVTGGSIIGQNNDGIRSLGGEIHIIGGTIEGKLDGIYANGKTFIGADDGSISVESPVIVGHSRYALETTGNTGFFDGVLKSRINPENGIHDVYNGLICIIPTGSVISEDFEYIDRKKYDIRYLDTKGNWLQIGDDESRQYNSLNAAVSAMHDGDTTIKVVLSSYIDFAQEINTERNVIFDLNGHSVVLTQPIVNKANTKIIDSGDNGYLNNIRDVVIDNQETLTINSGRINSEKSNAISNNNTLVVNNGFITSNSSESQLYSAIYNRGTATINNGTITGSYGISNNGTLTIKDGTITGNMQMGISSYSTVTIDGGTITGPTGIQDSDGILTINGGTITGTSGNGITTTGNTTINGGEITANSGDAIVNTEDELIVNGGVITSLTGNGIYNSGNWYRSANLTVNGGTITGATNGILNNHSSTSNYGNNINITDGVITGNNGVGLYTTTYTKILGGTLTGSTYGVYTSTSSDRYTEIGKDDGTINIDNPVLRGDIYGLYIDSGTLNFYDGILKGISERVNDYEKITRIAPRTEIMYSEETIDEKNYLTAYLFQEQDIARIMTVGKECTNQVRISEDNYCIYNNLQDAFDDAVNGETIQILETARNVPIYYNVVNSKEVTLDLNGKTLISTKNIINNGKLTVTSLNNSRGKLKTSMNNYLLRSTNELIVENIDLVNNSSTYSVINSTGKVTANDINIQAREGIYCEGELSVIDSTINVNNTAISSRGKLTVSGGTYSGGSYSIYSSTNSTVNVSNVTLNGNFYNTGSNTATVVNTTLNGYLQNYANMTIEEGTTPTKINNGLISYGTITINKAIIKNGVNIRSTATINESTITGGELSNSGNLTLNDSTFTSSVNGYYSDYPDFAVENSGTFNFNNSTITVSCDRNAGGIDNTGTINMNEGSILNTNGGTYLYALRNGSNGRVNISEGYINVTNATNAYGVYSTSENAKVILIGGAIDVRGTTTYGAYIKYGTFEMGVKEVGTLEDTSQANVSTTNPVVNSLGTNGIGIKKVNGSFNFYDGIIWGSKYSKPDTTSNVEKDWEATTYIDEDTGYEYTILEYMPNDYQQEGVAYLRGVSYKSLELALSKAENGDTIKLVRSTDESVTIPANLNVIINLNRYTVTGKTTNNGTLTIYNGTLTNFGEEALVNNGTFIMGEDDNTISGANVRIVSDKKAVINNGTFTMYDGYIEGNPSIEGIINIIPPLSRIRTSNTGQSERKTLQGLDEQSIIDRLTDLRITINPNTGYYDERNVEQEVYLKHGDTYDLNEHTIRKNGCDFDGWEVSDPDAYNNGVLTANLSDITVVAKWKVKDSTVAQIGTEYYDSLVDAIFHAKKGDKVILLKDVSEDITNDKDITLDLGGKTLTGAFINNANLRIVNGTIVNPEEDGIGIINTKSLTLGYLEDDVSTSSVGIIGESFGVQNDGMFNLYDGYVQGDIALYGRADNTPKGYYLFTERITVDNKIKQKLFLIGDPDNAVAETREGGNQFFFNLNDAINTSAITGYEIYIIKDFQATYEIDIPEGANIVIDFEGSNISTGNPINNNGTLLLHDSKEDKGSISMGNTINNSGSLTIDEIGITETAQSKVLVESTGNLKIKDATLNGTNTYTVHSTGTLSLEGDYSINSSLYGIKNEGNALTLNSGTIKGIDSYKDLTVEDGATIIGNGSGGYAAIALRSSNKLIVNGGTITSEGNNGIYNGGSNSEIEINGGTINATTGIYSNGSNTKYTVNDGTITATTQGVYLAAANCIFEMNGGSITATTYGILDNSSSNKIYINDGTITATNGIRENTSRSTGNNQSAFPEIFIKGGKITASTYGIYNYYSRVYITGGEVKSTGNYAVYNSSWCGLFLYDDGFINAPNTSAIYNDSGVEIHGGRITSGGKYGVYNNYTAFTMTGGVIEMTAANSYGVRAYGTNNFTGGEIKSANVGILNDTSATINLEKGFKVYGDTYGVLLNSGGTVNVGSTSDTLSTEIPLISGGLYGIYKSSGTTNFYSGRLRGYTYGYNDRFTTVLSGHSIIKVLESTGEENVKNITYSTTSQSSDALADTAKAGSGYARITYIGETTDNCTTNTSQVFSYTGTEETYTATCAGDYKLEVWGAQGGSAISANIGGYGGYSTGVITLTKNETLYINVGGAGQHVEGNNGKSIAGGYNGGGTGVSDPTSNYRYSGSGGGATHIALTTGLLSELEDKKDKVIIVAGGGAGSWSTGSSSNWETRTPGYGGGYEGSTGLGVSNGNDIVALGGTQTEGYAFGQGAGNGLPGGGGGWYGGRTYSYTAGGGSGYIGNTRLHDAYMYGYNVKSLGANWIINYLVTRDDFIQVGDNTYNSINAAQAAIEEGESGTMILLKDMELNELSTIDSGKVVTLDLNGNTLTVTREIVTNSSLTIVDNSDDKTGKLESAKGNIINSTKGTLTLDNVKVKSANYAITSSSTSNINIINGTVFEGTNGINSTGKKTIAISDSTFNITGTAVNTSAVDTTLNIEGNTINAGTAVYASINNTTINLTDNEITTTDIAINEQYWGITTTLEGNTIKSAKQGIYLNNNGCTLTINSGTLESTGSYAIYEYYNSSYSRNPITINGGTIKGASNAVYLNNGDFTMNGGTITTTSTSTSNYALVCQNNSTCVINNDSVITAENARGMYTSNSSVINGGSIISNLNDSGIALVVGGGSLTINDGLIKTTGSTGLNISENTATVTIKGGTIEGKRNGIYVVGESNKLKTLNIYGGTIKAEAYALNNGAYATTTIGESDKELNIESPLITGGEFAIYKSGGTINFYSGRLKGYSNIEESTFNTLRNKKTIHTELEVLNENVAVDTVPVYKYSSTPVEYQGKNGNGYAKVTYLGMNGQSGSIDIDEDEPEIITKLDCNLALGKANLFYSRKAVQEFVPSCNGTYKVELWGAQGGYRSNSSYGGKGGYTSGNITLDTSDKLYVVVGSYGNDGGYNGGGIRSGLGNYYGGGATDIRLVSDDLYSRIMVAAGGGSDGAGGKPGGYGGGLTGQSRTDSYGSGGGGATQTSGGSYRGTFGIGGSGTSANSGHAGAGGGGWYGGGGSDPDRSGDDDRGGGGGSSFAYTDSTVPIAGYNVDPKYKVTNAQLLNGSQNVPVHEGTGQMVGNSGNGFAKITLVETSENSPGSSETYNVIFETDIGHLDANVVEYNNGDTLGDYPVPVSDVPAYVFEGWYLDKEFTKKVTSNTIVQYSVTLYAKFVYDLEECDSLAGKTDSFEYTGSEQEFVAYCPGQYKLEVWGAAGGRALCNGSVCSTPGYGGYSTGKINLLANDKVFINVGGQGAQGITSSCAAGGYNGGGKGTNDGGGCGSASDDEASGGGGGATHIATKSGLLSTLENDKDKVLIVAGGGGGASYTYIGGSGGGALGGRTVHTTENVPSQTSGYAFGRGQDGTGAGDSDGVAGGGGGWYGGYTQNVASYTAGTGGSGYLNSYLDDAMMYQYQFDNPDVLYINYLSDKEGYLEVNNTSYSSFEEAIEAITGESGTIKVLKSLEIQEAVTFPSGKNITLDLNSKELSFNKSINNNGTLNITNGKIENNTAVPVNNYGTLTINNSTVMSKSNTAVVGRNANNSITINDSYLKGYNGLSTEALGNITINSGTIEGYSEAGIYLSGDSSTVTVNNGTINGKYGIRNNALSTSITINDGTIYGSSVGIYDDKAKATNTRSTFIINGGYIYGDSYGISTKYSVINIENATIASLGTNYAIYSNDNNSLIIDKKTTIKSMYGSGIYANSDFSINSSNVSISAGASNGYGIYIANGNNIINNVNITSNNIGIYIAKGVLTLNDAEVSAANAAICTDSSTNAKTIYVYGGNYIGKNYGIYQQGSTSTTLGNVDDDVSIDTPKIEGGLYGLYSNGGTVSFYSGRLIGATKAYSGTVNNIREGYEIFDDYNTAGSYLVGERTYSVTSHSEEALANTPKEGNGYAKVTYSRYSSDYNNDYEIVTNDDEYVDCSSLIGKEYVFTSVRDVQVFEPVCNGEFKLEVWGGQGGYRSDSSNGGKGGYSYGTITLLEKEKLYVYVGASGNNGGFNGGGTRELGTNYGGGATDIRLNKGDLYSRVIVAGGGGSDGATNKPGGYAGGLTGQSRTESYGSGGNGATKYSGGTYRGEFGQGGSSAGSGGHAGAGGGGWYGGGGATTDGSGDDDRGGGGGSSFIYVGEAYIPQGYNVDEKYMLKSAGLKAGNEQMPSHDGLTTMTGNTGDGYAKITYTRVLTPSSYKITLKTSMGTLTNNVLKYNRGTEIGNIPGPVVDNPDIQFEGWYLDKEYTKKISPSYKVDNNLTLYAKFTFLNDYCSGLLTEEHVFDYTGSEQTFTPVCPGTYTLEVWGAQGGNSSYNDIHKTGGYGGYSKAEITLNQNETLYINVGGKGQGITYQQSEDIKTFDNGTGYNGGGMASYATDNSSHGGGGGATHIALRSGLLSTLSAIKSDVLIVAGGGGGSSSHSSSPNYTGDGGSGGGYIGGSGINDSNTCYSYGNGGTQTSGGTYTTCAVSNNTSRDGAPNNPTFGSGSNIKASSTNYNYAGGGGGWYGGQSGFHAAGGGGSGYTGNSRLTNTAMYGYNVSDKYSNDSNVAYLVLAKTFVRNTNKQKDYSNLQEAFNDANSGDTIMLLDNNSISYNVTVGSSTNVTLDLNGFNLMSTKTIINNGTVNIVNNKNGTTSKISTAISNTFITNNGTLNIDSVNISGYNVLENSSTGSMVLNNLTITSTNNAITSPGDLSLTDVTLTASTTGIDAGGTTSILRSTITAPTGIKSGANGTLTINNSNINSTNTGVRNLGILIIDESVIHGNINAIYSEGTKNETITDSSLESNSYSYYRYHDGITLIDNTTLVGNLYGQNINSSITVKNKTLSGYIYSNGSLTLNNMTINYTNENSNNTYAIENRGTLNIKDSSVTFITTYQSSGSNTNSTVGIHNSGTMVSTNNDITVKKENTNYKNKHLKGIQNTGLLTSTDDNIVLINGNIASAVYNNTSNTATVTNLTADISGFNTGYGLYNNAGTFNDDSNSINIHDCTNGSSIVVIKDTFNSINSTHTITDNTNGNGAEVLGGTLTIKTGTLNVHTTNDAYGIKATAGTVILGEVDSVQTSEADVSTTNPHIEAIGTNSGIGVTIGAGRFEYYDGILIGSTSSRISTEYIHATQTDFIPLVSDYMVDNVKQYEYCILQYSK